MDGYDGDRKQSVIRDRKSKVIVPSQNPTIRWDKNTKRVALLSSPRREGRSRYEYEVYLSIGHIQEIIGSLADRAYALQKDKLK
jgi:hypothetical protein